MRPTDLPIIWRDQGGVSRAYLDLRKAARNMRLDRAQVEAALQASGIACPTRPKEGAAAAPAKVAITPAGGSQATADRAVALRLGSAFWTALVNGAAARERMGLDPSVELESFALQHVVAKRESGQFAAAWLDAIGVWLARAVQYFNAIQPGELAAQRSERTIVLPRNLAQITPPDVQGFMRWLGTQTTARGQQMQPQTIRHHLSALSGVYARAISEGRLPLGGNPVAALLDRPSVPASTTPLRSPADMALLIEAARTLPSPAAAARGFGPLPYAYELTAFMALTGVREGEARSIRVRHLDFTDDLVDVIGTKTAGAVRIVPMATQLRDILRAYLIRTGRLFQPDAYVFSVDGVRPFGEWRKTLDAIAVRGGFKRGEIRTRQFRVAYASHRCTCDGVDANTVRLELGHADLSMMARVYARAQRRAERMGAEMDYSVGRWAARIGERLEQMGTHAATWRAEAAAERVAVVRAFLASVEGMTMKRVHEVTGVDRNAIQRLRAGTATDVKNATLETMRAHLARNAERVA